VGARVSYLEHPVAAVLLSLSLSFYLSFFLFSDSERWSAAMQTLDRGSCPRARTAQWWPGVHPRAPRSSRYLLSLSLVSVLMPRTGIRTQQSVVLRHLDARPALCHRFWRPHCKRLPSGLSCVAVTSGKSVMADSTPERAADVHIRAGAACSCCAHDPTRSWGHNSDSVCFRFFSFLIISKVFRSEVVRVVRRGVGCARE
jgi:hypothetical protein